MSPALDLTSYLPSDTKIFGVYARQINADLRFVNITLYLKKGLIFCLQERLARTKCGVHPCDCWAAVRAILYLWLFLFSQHVGWPS